MIICASPTTTLERNWIIPNFSIGGFYRVEQESIYASGKGVNVGRVVRRLGGEVMCTGFVGGPTGQHFQMLIEQEGIRGSWTQAAIDTRQSITVYDPENTRDATSFCPRGPAIAADEWRDFASKLDDLAKDAKNISISGNIPAGIEADKFSAIIRKFGGQSKQVWLDISGGMLKVGAEAHPFAIKVNLKEISELAEQSIGNQTDALTISRSVRERYEIPIVCVTLGSQGAVCSSAWGDMIIHPIQMVKFVSSIGCGDAFMAGLIMKFDQGCSLIECLASAAAAASANTQELGPGIFKIEDYHQALEKAIVESVG